MYRGEGKNTDHTYMYEFRTKPCTKEWCQNPSRCFDAHSEIMRRRVPKQGRKGLFNYIPKPCLQWMKNKRCTFGDSCPRSHGWLEVIYHPLLYKTKLCKSYHRNGTCREYGVYCAKAHHPTEIRSLVKIYGWDWKRHYDLSSWEERKEPIALSESKCIESRETRVAGSSENESGGEKLLNDCLPGESKSLKKLCSQQNQKEASSKTDVEVNPSQDILHTSGIPSLLLASPPLFGVLNSVSDRMSDMVLDDEVSSYIELYDMEMIRSGVDSMKFICDSPVPPTPSDHKPGSQGTPFPQD